MNYNRIFCLWLIVCTVLWSACEKESPEAPTIDLIATSVNGGFLADGATNVDPNATIGLIFTAGIDPAKFESAFSIEPATALDFSYTSQSSRVDIEVALDFNTVYTLRVSGDAIGANDGRLEAPFALTFTTKMEGGASSSACTEGNENCLESLTLDNQTSFPFYASFPIYEEQQEWEDLTAAVIVIHGANRNADDYFTYLASGLLVGERTGNTVLVAPLFQDESTAADDELYWSGNGWREGRPSSAPSAVSAFGLVDQLIDRLADKTSFPNLETIVVTGHSSGGLFTHLFAAANQSEPAYPELEFEYVVANSQYFYYPNGQRIDEADNQLFVPTDCNGYTIWPLGYDVRPSYLSGTEEATFNDQFIARSITYLLGNGDGPDPSLNTTDCAAVLLGSSRYQRGENMFRYMELVYGDSHNHERSIVPGVGHDGAGMYRSEAFKSLLADLLGD